ncbi:MAG: hypothetical protein HKN45_01805 [Flavobacteriales bacterium]|nr:hypothetical protein [Flavobacteriales bacterium]
MRHILIFSLIGFFSSCTKYSCDDFRTGNYVYSDTAFADVRISRTLTGEQDFKVTTSRGTETITKQIGEQTEKMTRDGRDVTDVYSVIWDGPCSYTLVFKSTSSQVDQFHTKYDTIRTQILEPTRKGYSFESRLYGERLQGELIKVED